MEVKRFEVKVIIYFNEINDHNNYFDYRNEERYKNMLKMK